MDYAHQLPFTLPKRQKSKLAVSPHSSLFHDGHYSDDQWERHRHWVRHFPEPKRFFLVLYGLWPVVGWSVLVSLAVGLYYELGQKHHDGWPVLVRPAYLQPFILTSFAVSLLLVFRTNSSYDRWWEVRKAFGMIYNCVRSLARMTTTYIAPQQPMIAAEILRWDAILCPASCAFLCDDPTYLDPHSDLLSTEQMAWLREAEQPPIAVSQAIAALIQKSGATEYERVTMMGQLTQFDICLGACERVRRQTIPMAYTRHTSRFIISFVTFLPFGLWAYTSWLTLPVMGVITFLLVGIENIGVQIEQPMLVLPLDAISSGCREAVEALNKVQRGADKWADQAYSQAMQ